MADENEKVNGAPPEADVDRRDEQVTEEAQATENAPLSPLAQEVVALIGRHLPHLVPSARTDGWIEAYVDADSLPETARTLRDRLKMDYLSLISAVDYQDKGFEVVYHLISLATHRKIVLKVKLEDREQPTAPSVVDIWPTADFHEREAWDLMGIKFSGHPDLRRILMREDWIGHPLRKDYVDDRAPRERKTKETYYEAHVVERQLNDR